jgi:DNA ligase-1
MIWHGLRAPYEDLFAWLEGRAGKPEASDPAPFRPPMLSHPLEDEDFSKLDPQAFRAEWKWDGIRVQAVSARPATGARPPRLFPHGRGHLQGLPRPRRGARFRGALDGELLILRGGRVQSFNVLQQRLNRKTVTPKLLEEFPAHIRVYDILAEGGRGSARAAFRRAPPAARALPRRARRRAHRPLALHPLRVLGRARGRPGRSGAVGAGADAEAIEGVMVKRADSPYVPGRPKGLWYKWKRSPYLVDAVMMYAQRGHGKRSSFYSDYTFGVWRSGPEGDELVPVGKAYHGFTDEELAKLDRYVRNHTVNRFGPVREVEYGSAKGLVLEIAFEGLQRSTRHKSGVAMRFPRVHRIAGTSPGGSRPDRGPGSDPEAGRAGDLPAGGERVRRLEALAAGAVTRQAVARLIVGTSGPGFVEVTGEVAASSRRPASPRACSPSSAATPRLP